MTATENPAGDTGGVLINEVSGSRASASVSQNMGSAVPVATDLANDTRSGIAAGQRLLDTITNKCGWLPASQVTAPAPTALDPKALRTARWAALGGMWFSTLRRVRACGRQSIRPLGTVDVLAGASFDGLMMCGSVWACPVCSAKIQSVRSVELATLQNWADSRGYTTLFGTMTLRHRPGQRLADLLGRSASGPTDKQRRDHAAAAMLYEAHQSRGCDCATCAKGFPPEPGGRKGSGLAGCFAAVRQNGRVRRLRKRFGYLGYVRVLEETYGDNGWHPHIHVVHVYERALTDEDILAIHDAEFNAWRAAARRFGLGEPVRAASDLQRAAGQFSDYLTKQRFFHRDMDTAKVSYELTGRWSKTGRGSRTPFQILEAAIDGAEANDIELWQEYETATFQRRQMTWSRGLKDICGVNDVSDEDAANTVADDPIRFVVADWVRDIGRRWDRGRVIAGLLDAVDDADPSAALGFCESQGIEITDTLDSRAIYDRLAVVERTDPEFYSPPAARRAREVLRDRVLTTLTDEIESLANAVEVAVEECENASDPDVRADAEYVVGEALSAYQRAIVRYEREYGREAIDYTRADADRAARNAGLTDAAAALSDADFDRLPHTTADDMATMVDAVVAAVESGSCDWAGSLSIPADAHLIAVAGSDDDRRRVDSAVASRRQMLAVERDATRARADAARARAEREAEAAEAAERARRVAAEAAHAAHNQALRDAGIAYNDPFDPLPLAG